jgi:hypothetical protein
VTFPYVCTMYFSLTHPPPLFSLPLLKITLAGTSAPYLHIYKKHTNLTHLHLSSSLTLFLLVPSLYQDLIYIPVLCLSACSLLSGFCLVILPGNILYFTHSNHPCLTLSFPLSSTPYWPIIFGAFHYMERHFELSY